MGTEFSLLRNNERFDLDKGCWEKLKFPFNRCFKISEFFLSRDQLAEDIKNKVYPGNISMDDNYFSEVASRIFQWCEDNDVEFIADSTYEGYFDIPITEDRFTPRLFKKETQDDK